MKRTFYIETTDVLVILTDGWNKKKKKPTPAAILRLQKGAEIVQYPKIYSVDGKIVIFKERAIIGGYPDEFGITFAEHYNDWWKEMYPGIEPLTIVDGSSNNTVYDLEGLVKILRTKYPYQQLRLHIVTSKGHYNRITSTLKKLRVSGYHIDSGEKEESVTLPDFLEKMSLFKKDKPRRFAKWSLAVALKLVNIIDPLWKGWFGRKLAAQAEQNALKYRNGE